MAKAAAASGGSGPSEAAINLKVNVEVPKVQSLTTMANQLKAIREEVGKLRDAYRGIFSPTTGLMGKAKLDKVGWDVWLSGEGSPGSAALRGGHYMPKDLAKALFGFGPEQLKQATETMRWQIELAHREIERAARSVLKGSWTGGKLTNDQALKVLPHVVNPLIAEMTAGESALQRMLTGFTSGSGIGFASSKGAKAGAAVAGGPINLTIPAAQIKAVVSGDVILDLTGHVKVVGGVQAGVPSANPASSVSVIPPPATKAPPITRSGSPPSGVAANEVEVYNAKGEVVGIRRTYVDRQGRIIRTSQPEGGAEVTRQADLKQPAARSLTEWNARMADIAHRAQANIRGAGSDYGAKIAAMEAARAQLQALTPTGLTPFDEALFAQRQRAAIHGAGRAIAGFRKRQDAAATRQQERWSGQEAKAWESESQQARRAQDMADRAAESERVQSGRRADRFNTAQENAYGRLSEQARRENDAARRRNVSLGAASQSEATLLAEGWTVSGERVIPRERSIRVERTFSRGDQRRAVTRFYGAGSVADAAASGSFDFMDPASYSGLTPSGASVGAPRDLPSAGRGRSSAPGSAPGGYRNKDWLANTANVTSWASSVWALYGALNAAQRSMSMLVETGMQTARLEQVFSHIGGTTRQLRDDLLAAASANGRLGSEAMEAAVSWARLGLSRRDMRTAVSTSLIAANVAEMSAGEATQYIQSVTQPYNKRPSEMPTMLAELNEISNRFNAAPRDILIGLSRTASVAKQSGMPLPQLMGMIGATVGTTGQSGQNVGNAMKSFIIALSNPDVQGYLKSSYGVDVSTRGGGDTKPMPEILDDLFVAYSDSKGRTRQDRMGMLTRVANKTQASRVAAMMDSYVTGARLAINAQLDLNSAQKENARILNTLKAQLTGLITEYQRFITIQFSGGKLGASWAEELAASGHTTAASALRAFTPEGASINALRSLRGGLAILNTDGGSVFSGLAMSAAGAMAGGMALRKLQSVWSEAAKPEDQRKAGFGVTTAARVREMVVPAGGWADERIAQREGASGRQIGRVERYGMRAGQLWAGMAQGAARLAPKAMKFAGGMMAADLVVWGLAEAIEAMGFSSNKAADSLETFNRRIEQHKEAAAAGESALRLYSTVGRAIPNASQKDRLRWAEQLGNLDGSYTLTPKEIEDLKAGGTDWQQSASKRARERMYEERDNKLILIQRAKRAALAEAKRMEGFGRTDKQLEFETIASGYDNEALQYAQDEEEGIPDNMLTSPHKIAIARRHGAVSNADLIFGNLPSRTVAEQEANVMAGLLAKRGLLQAHAAQLTAIKNREMTPAAAAEELAKEESKSKLVALREQLERTDSLAVIAGLSPTKVREIALPFGLSGSQRISSEITQEELRLKKLEAGRSGDIPFISKLQSLNTSDTEATEQEIAQQAARMAGAIARTRTDWSLTQAGARMDKYGVGSNVAEEALNRRIGLAKELAAAEADVAKAIEGTQERAEALLRVKEATGRMNQADLDILTAKDRLAKSEAELAIRSQRELRSGLLAGGPEDLMQYVAAWRLTHDSKGKPRDIGYGELLTYEPELKSAMFKLRPDLSPEGYEIRRGQRQVDDAIRGRGGASWIAGDMNATLGRNLGATAALGEGGFWNDAMSLSAASVKMSEAANTFQSSVMLFHAAVSDFQSREPKRLPANQDSSLNSPDGGFAASAF